jgi:hypothetical protein
VAHAVGNGGMSDGFDEDAPRQWLGLTRMRAGIFASVAVIAIFYLFGPKPVPFVNPKIAAEPFIWAEGCEVKSYAETEEISPRCLLQKYEITKWESYGWKRRPRGSTRYFRIENDVISVGCDLNPKSCFIFDKIDDVFISDNKVR